MKSISTDIANVAFLGSATAIVAAAGGVAQAQVIRTNVDGPTVSAESDLATLQALDEASLPLVTDSALIDIDGNGTNELELRVVTRMFAGGDEDFEFDFELEFLNGSFDIAPTPDPNAFGDFTDASFDFTPFFSNIGPDLDPGLSNAVDVSGESVRGLADSSFGSTDLKGGLFNEDPIRDIGALGLSFQIDGEEHFGAIYFDLIESFDEGGFGEDVAVQVLFTEYEATPGGSYTVIPSPASLVPMVLGAAALGGRKRAAVGRRG